MIKSVYAVYDKGAAAYLNPFTEVNDDVAMRSFAFAFKDPSSIMAFQPTDFQLEWLGTFDTVTGSIEIGSHRIIARGTDYV